MTSNSGGQKLADYFFVAGVNDNDLLATYKAAKEGQQTTSDEFYYQRQNTAAAQVLDKDRPSDTNDNATKKHQEDRALRDATFGVLDHVQAVIDNFDKERDSIRDTVIAVLDQGELAEKYTKRPEARNPSKSTHVAATTSRTTLQQSHTWQSLPEGTA